MIHSVSKRERKEGDTFHLRRNREGTEMSPESCLLTTLLQIAKRLAGKPLIPVLNGNLWADQAGIICVIYSLY